MGIRYLRVIGWAAILLAAGAPGMAAERPARPNILLAIADDWGWPHAGAYGGPVVQTPYFDLVARAGALCPLAFVSAPSCTPSRNALLTGQWHWRLGPGANLWSTLPQDLKVYPHLLRAAGYHVGHWRKAWGPGRLDGRWRTDHPAGPAFPKGFREFLQTRPAGAPFAFWLGSTDPHRPYEEGSGRRSGLDLARIRLFPHFPDNAVVRGDVADYYHEVQRFDRDLGEALRLLDEIGEAANTLVVVTGDHGMPFPRCKGNLYDSGARVPLAFRWPARIKPGQVMPGFVSLTDLAPTFLEAAGLAAPAEMTGRSLLAALTGGPPARDHVLIGKERHVPCQEWPDLGGTPMRALRTQRYLYVRNYRPDRWPAGTPHWQKAALPGTWLGDCDNGPTKEWIAQHRDRDGAGRRAYELAFARRPGEELYDLAKDPDQLVNVAADPRYEPVKEWLATRMVGELWASGDPRYHGCGCTYFDRYPYFGGAPKHPDYPEPDRPARVK